MMPVKLSIWNWPAWNYIEVLWMQCTHFNVILKWLNRPLPGLGDKYSQFPQIVIRLWCYNYYTYVLYYGISSCSKAVPCSCCRHLHFGQMMCINNVESYGAQTHTSMLLKDYRFVQCTCRAISSSCTLNYSLMISGINVVELITLQWCMGEARNKNLHADSGRADSWPWCPHPPPPHAKRGPCYLD